MMPMLPMCDSRAMLMPMGQGMSGMAPAMVPMMPMAGGPMMPMAGGPMMPMAGGPMYYPMNNLNMFSTTSIMSEYDRHMYGRFRHVEREHPQYRHAPFDWYRPPKQRHNIIHEDAAVVTHDGPVPIGDFYRYYIYGDEDDDQDDYDDRDEYYEDDEHSSSFDSDDYDDTVDPSYEQRAAGYRRNPREAPGFADENTGMNRPSMGRNNLGAANANRRTTFPTTTARPANRTLGRNDNFDDAASVNSTYDN
ncbi:unnamed protein product [Rotaria magnacalcarata]